MTASEKLFAAEGHWLMGRVIPHNLFEGIGKHLAVVADALAQRFADDHAEGGQDAIEK